MTCTIKFWLDMDGGGGGGTTCGKGGPKFAVTDGPGGLFLRGDQKFRDRTRQHALYLFRKIFPGSVSPKA